ncbi:PREDICTED: uncharacterized protein LOC108558488 [Nicrophorus vespilloides]|uniref:Uncharacterized protein LOC108558488 n=1 Tax=Nicrophorus vespilloides TaxID=110193 RepID=A0ABM1M8J4_NICVS|nr:PREDICTED: uncharacterized protein LOC108558488 [Nicrophorus vespilloides]
MKKRSLAGNVGLGFFVVTLVLVAVSFSTPSWLVSDPRINGARLNRLGLWTHCFRSLPDPNSPNSLNAHRFFVGCRWIYDPFTSGYDEIRGFLVPGFMKATQFFYTLCFISVLISTILSLIYFLCCRPDQKRFIELVKIIACVLMVGGICGSIAVIIFASLGNRNNWMPGHDNNFFGWSFILACIGSATCIIAAVLFFVDADIYRRKENYFKESQSRFEFEDTKT